MNISNIIVIIELIIFLSSLFIFINVNGSCSHTVSGHTIDLSSISGKSLSVTSGDWTYYYTPCSDSLSCTGNGATTATYAMADQYRAGNDFCTAYLALWEDVTPTYSDGVFTFTWGNGQSSNNCASGRGFIAKFSCGSSGTTATSISTSTDGCTYTMTLTSELACDGGSSGGSGSSDDTDGLSLGSILIIIVVSIVFAYCVVGYIICAKKNPENGWGNVKANTPHLNFWCLVPKWTWAGCCVTKEFLMEKYAKIKGGAGGDGSYDTVADE